MISRWQPIVREPSFITDSGLGRNFRAIAEIHEIFKGRRAPMVAWDVGPGQTLSEGHARGIPYEHLEVANALEEAGAEYRLYVVEPDEQIIAKAKAALRAGMVKLSPMEDNRDPGYGAYLDRFFGYCAAPESDYWRIPESFRERIKFVGPEKEGEGGAGNVFCSLPNERPDLVTCHNLAYHYYDSKVGRKIGEADYEAGWTLLKHLIKAMKKNALLSVDPETNRIFGEKLASVLQPHFYASPGVFLYSKTSVGFQERVDNLKRFLRGARNRIHFFKPAVRYTALTNL